MSAARVLCHFFCRGLALKRRCWSRTGIQMLHIPRDATCCNVNCTAQFTVAMARTERLLNTVLERESARRFALAVLSMSKLSDKIYVVCDADRVRRLMWLELKRRVLIFEDCRLLSNASLCGARPPWLPNFHQVSQVDTIVH